MASTAPSQEAAAPLISRDVEEEAIEELLQAAAAGETDINARLKIAVITQWCFVVLFVALLAAVLIVAPPWNFPKCDRFQTSWPLVWVVLMLIHTLLLVLMSHIRWQGNRPPKFLFHVQRVLRSFNTIWFFCGIKPLFWDASCSDISGKLARSFWWLQATFFLIPLFCYLLICLCLPCIILVLNRVRTPSANETPTPEWILSKLEVRKYQELLDALRTEFAQEVEFASPANMLSEALNRNPIMQAISSAGGLGPAASQPPIAPHDHESLLHPMRGPSASRLKIEKGCPICMADFEELEDVMVMPCDRRHFFHVDCVTQWLRNSQFCPICRANIVTLLAPDGQSPPPSNHVSSPRRSTIELNHATPDPAN